MNREEKLALLSGLSEKDLTRKFLIPLFEAMHYTFIDYSHGKLEKGKDLILMEEDNYPYFYTTARIGREQEIPQKFY